MVYPGGPQIQSQSVRYKNGGRESIDYRRRESIVTTEADIGMMWPKNVSSYNKLEEARNEFFPRASGGSTALPTPDFSTVKLILDFWPSEL